MTPRPPVDHFLAFLAAAALLAPACGGPSEPENRSPTASISSPSEGAAFAEGSQVTFRGSGSDPDQGEITGGSLAWKSDLDGALGTGTTLSRTDLSAGDHVVTLTATDSEGATGTATVSITVEPNQEPSASIGSPSEGATFGQGAPVEFRGSGDDPEDGTLSGSSLEWSSDLDGTLGNGSPLTRTDLSVGDHTVTLTATDALGATGTATVSLTVEANGQPAATITSPSDGVTIQEDESITFEGSGSDPEDGSLSGSSLVWTSDVDGQIGTGQSFTRGDLSAADHTITLEATDSRGASTTASVGLTVEGDPTVTIGSPADSSIFDEGVAVSFEGSATDPGDGPLTGSSLVWSSDVDGELGTGETLSESGLSQGPHRITLTARDSDGNESSDSVKILVESPGFDIRVRILSDVTASEEQTIRDGISFWEPIVTGDLGPRWLPQHDVCLTEEQEGVDDLLVVVRVVAIDGAGGTLARAGPCWVRQDADGNLTLPVSGIVEVDEADFGNSQLREVVTHEVGHVLGIGIGVLEGWDSATRDLATHDPYFAGAAADSAFDDLGGEAHLSDGVPLENFGGQGTRGGHWREDNLDAELMTGFINSGTENPVSRLSVASLSDIGYEVDLARAESFTLPMPQVALWEAESDATLSRPASSSENFGGPGSPLGEAIVVGANDDTWTSDPGDERFTGLLRFGVPSVPAGVTITGAELELRVQQLDDETTGHDVEVLPVTSAWTESTVTWDDRPSLGSSPVLTYLHDECRVCFLSDPDLLQLVRDWASGATTNHGLALEAPDAASDPTFSVGYWTRHADVALMRPEMVVSAETGAALKAARTEPIRRIPLGDDILRLPITAVGPDSEVRRIQPVAWE